MGAAGGHDASDAPRRDLIRYSSFRQTSACAMLIRLAEGSRAMITLYGMASPVA